MLLTGLTLNFTCALSDEVVFERNALLFGRSTAFDGRQENLPAYNWGVFDLNSVILKIHTDLNSVIAKTQSSSTVLLWRCIVIFNSCHVRAECLDPQVPQQCYREDKIVSNSITGKMHSDLQQFSRQG